MRKVSLVLASACLLSCMGPDEGPPTLSNLPSGVYRGNHGALTRIRGFESELILGAEGNFRYFQIDSNTAVLTTKGKWSASDKEMVWSKSSRSSLYHGGFRVWDTLAAPDTSYLRNITDSGFERLESTLDSQFSQVIRWIKYRRIPEPNPLPGGAFVFSETFMDGVDTALTDTSLTRLDITHDGLCIQNIYRNGELYSTDVDSQWTQAGSFLITSHNHFCSYDSTGSYCGDTPSDFEWVARLDRIRDTAFNLWISPFFTLQDHPFWAIFRKEP